MRRRKRKRDEAEEEERRLEALPPAEFCHWWNPTSLHEPSMASVGGHPDAERVWVRKDPGRWVRRTYGITANKAWLCQCYQDEYYRWIDAGKPDQEPFVSICATLEAQYALWKEIEKLVAQIGKKMPGSPDERQRKQLLQQQKVDLLKDSKPDLHRDGFPPTDADVGDPIDF